MLFLVFKFNSHALECIFWEPECKNNREEMHYLYLFG